ncbi:TIR domain-containing protein [Desulfobulbus sp.]|uniref:TIR domain-containing protein n=1 Tax=Desulfobulbus sp. TaxID=895 RepID=UPI0027BA9FFC|nr:TIR domain-containing protein [Desulfobulbus sp.]
MDATQRKKISVITKYAVENFHEGDWYTIGQLTGKIRLINDHSRLLRSLSFGDEDYSYCAAEVISDIFDSEPDLIDEIIDHFDIDLWYEQKYPEKYQRIFIENQIAKAEFWNDGYLKLFISHLSSNKNRMSHIKRRLSKWGISSFIAHEDIEPSKEWRDEVEAGLDTMEVIAAVVEPGFKESDWCSQEVGYALGKKIDIIPIRAGLDPFGFFGKYQGIQAKGKLPEKVADEISNLLMKKPKHRDKLLRAMPKSFSKLDSKEKIDFFETLDSWGVVTDDQIKQLLEQSSLSNHEKEKLKHIINRVDAFIEQTELTSPSFFGDDVPF